MGRITAPYGVRGWVKIRPYTARPANLLAYPAWWIAEAEGWMPCRLAAGRVRGETVLARIEGCEDRDAASRLKGREVAVERAQLPPPPPGEYYWADLLGLEVVNVQGQPLGRVAQILPTGANDVLVLEAERERLIPFIAQAIREVDLAGGVIRVDWDADY
jgi:16S rRNA processing protein RimM